MPASRQPADQRRRDMAQIHIAKAQLAMDDDTYRAMLWSLARVRSAADLDWSGRRRVLDHLRECGADVGGRTTSRQSEWAFIDKAPEDLRPMLRKICVLARKAGGGKSYVEGIAKQMEGGAVIKPLEFCDYIDLRRLIAALQKHLDRKERNS